MGIVKAIIPKVPKVRVWPANMVLASTDTFAFAVPTQDAAQSAPDPSVDVLERGPVADGPGKGGQRGVGSEAQVLEGAEAVEVRFGLVVCLHLRGVVPDLRRDFGVTAVLAAAAVKQQRGGQNPPPSPRGRVRRMIRVPVRLRKLR